MAARTPGRAVVNFEDYINVTVLPTGDIDSCWDRVNWYQQDVNPNLQGPISMQALISDVQSGAPVANATLDLWFGNDPTAGGPDYSVVSGKDGYAGSKFRTCTPVAYRTSTDPKTQATVDTYELNMVQPFSKVTLYPIFDSVSSTSYANFPAVLGVSPDGDKGIISGTTRGCGADPVEGSQIVVKDHATGAIPKSLVVKYYVDSFPNRVQKYTSADGKWVAINVPPGTWDIESYVSDGADGYVLIAKATATVFPLSIVVSDLYTAFDDGIRYPANCTL